MDKTIMFFQLFFGGFRTFRFGRGINRIDDHSFPLFSGREKFIRIRDCFFHKNPFLQPTKCVFSTCLVTLVQRAEMVPCFCYIGVNEIKLIKATLYVL